MPLNQRDERIPNSSESYCDVMLLKISMAGNGVGLFGMLSTMLRHRVDASTAGHCGANAGLTWGFAEMPRSQLLLGNTRMEESISRSV